MRPVFLNLCSILCMLLIVFSCVKEKSYEDLSSKGSLHSNITGECLPAEVSGTYIADSALVDSANFIQLTTDITKTGTYIISSDTVDGIYFRGEGNVNQLGTVLLTIQGYGKPIASGTFTLNITYGSTTCPTEITVSNNTSGGTSSVYTVEDVSGDCPTPSFAGTYMAGVALDAANTLSFTVHVTTPGTYAFNIAAGSDITFTGSGTFADTGTHAVVLQATGTPQAEGDLTVSAGNCDFTLTVSPNNLPDAVYTINCGFAQPNGTYQAGTAMTSENTLAIMATVTTAGKFSLTTTEVNGVTFSATGTFSSASTTHTITLTAGGTPADAGTFTFNLSGNGVSCSFPVTFAAAPAAAVFTLAGAPDACTNATVNGTYTAGTAADASNSVTVTVNVTAIGTYTIATNTANGISFSGSGSFTQTGNQAITLQASGTPAAGGSTTLTPQAGASSCSFDVPVADAPPVPTGIFTCKIDGIAMAFNDRAQATNAPDITNNPQLYLDGFTAPANGGYIPEMQIFITTTDGSTIKTGTYDEKHYIPPGNYRIEIDYHVVNADNTVTIWNTSSNFLDTNPPFTIVVTSLTSSRVKGTFSGKLTNLFEGSTGTKTVTEGTFDLPIVP